MIEILSPRIKPAAYLLMTLFFLAFLSGCTGSDDAGNGAVLNVILATHASTANAGPPNQLIPAETTAFHVDLLDNSGSEIDSAQVNVDPSEDNVTVTFHSLYEGLYRIRVSAFDSDNVILGTQEKPAVITQVENTITVSTLAAAQVYYTSSHTLPQTENARSLAGFLSHDQSGYHLQSYCVWGRLGEDQEPVNAYLAIAQRLNKEAPHFGSYRFPIVVAGAGYNNAETARIIFGGSYGIAELSEAVIVTQPWHVYVASLNNPNDNYPDGYAFNTTEMMLLSGQMGQAGAQYRITTKTIDLEKGKLQTDVVMTDVMGVVNQGYGPASFFPQWLLPAQREAISGDEFSGSVKKYLERTEDPMTDQGSFYYSAPMLRVDSYSIIRNDQIVSKGHDGLLWMDIVYQSFDDSAQEIVSTATWNFFTMQFSDRAQALMVTKVDNEINGSIPAASLFSTKGPRSSNGALSPEFRWNLQDINIAPDTSYTWTSPESKLTYYTRYHIFLNGIRRADLVVTMAWDAQELKINEIVKYEGYATVNGTLEGQWVEGSAWVEVQPAGHL